jgi:hypothetical protein
MLDLTEAGVVAWFTQVSPLCPNNIWPPATRSIERDSAVQPLLDELGFVLSEVYADAPQALQHIFDEEAARCDLQIVLAQLGAARLLRIIDWFATLQPDGELKVLQLSGGETAEGKALASSIRTLTARATITRMFGPYRVAELQSCAQAVEETQEKP